MDVIAVSAGRGEDPEQQRILDVARDQFIEHGRRRVRLMDIAQAAGVSRPTVYKRCGTRDEIFLAVLGQELNLLFERVSELLRSDSSIAERAVDVFVHGMRLTKSNPILAAVKKYEPETALVLTTDTGAAGFFALSGMTARAISPDRADDPLIARTAEYVTRQIFSFLLLESEVLPVDVDAQARRFAEDYIGSAVRALRAETALP